MTKKFDGTLYLVTDAALSSPRTVEEVVRLAVKGGVTAVQLREKESTTRHILEVGKALKQFLEPLGVPLLVNDRVDIALALEADGVHLGQSDMPYDDARRLLGQKAIIGVSIETLEQVKELEESDVDYFALSPVFSTPTKPDTVTEWGIEGLRIVRTMTKHMLIAIGGINLSNVRTIINEGADGVAVVSAICAAPDPEEASRQLRSVIDGARKEKYET